MKFYRWFAALMVVFLFSCEHSRLAFSGDPATEYHDTLRSLTQYQRLFGLDKTLYETYITYVSPELSQKYADEYAKIFSLTPEKKNEMLQQAKQDQERYDDFMVAHYASDIDNQNLNKSAPDMIVWKFFLQSGDGSLIESMEITPEKLGTQRTYFYPYLTGWNKLYRVRFPKSSSTQKKLLMKGPLRELTFTWK